MRTVDSSHMGNRKRNHQLLAVHVVTAMRGAQGPRVVTAMHRLRGPCVQEEQRAVSAEAATVVVVGAKVVRAAVALEAR